jgi:type VI secretion system protein ImpM
VTQAVSVGFFGKLPCNGDFVQRRVPQSFLDVWDPWLQECIHASRTDLQEQWLPTYLTSPSWRFVLPEAVCGSGAYAGVVAPSVDRVGRYFPLTIVTQVDSGANPLEFATRRTLWFDALDSLIIQALEETQIDLEWFDGQVSELAGLLEDEETAAAGLQSLLDASAFPQQHASWRMPLNGAQGLQSAINVFAYRELSAQLRPVSVWWTEGSEAVGASWLSLRSLPQPGLFAAMLDGRWVAHGWHDLGELGEHQRPSRTPTSATDEPQPDHGLAPAAPHATVPDLQLSAVEENCAAFVLRPEIGLWAVTATPQHQDPTAVRLISDALQQLAPASSLTALIESVRHAMAEVNGNLAQLAVRDVQSVLSHANVMVLVLSGAECALLSAGDVQALRIRARQVERVDQPADFDSGSSGAGSLMELLTGSPESASGIGATGFRDLRVLFERMVREDQWILCALPVFGESDISQLAATAASGLGVDARAVAAMVSARTRSDAVMPLMSLEL